MSTSSVKNVLSVAGREVVLGECKAKDTGNVYWVAGGQPQDARFGVKVKALAATLPTEVVLNGETIALEHKVRDRDSKKQAAVHGHPVLIEGQEKAAKVILTDHGDGTWQLTAAIHGKSGGAKAVRDDIFA